MDEKILRCAGMTDVGLVRVENQDNYFIDTGERLFVVADGMGGASNGALASRLAVQSVQTFLEQKAPPADGDEAAREWMGALINNANKTVCEASEGKSSKHNPMGTTIVAAYVAGNHAHVAHVGDSRAYLVRQGKVVMLTEDHSVVWEMYRRGQLTEQQARINQLRHIITRCLGHDETIVVDQSTHELQPGDWLLLFSDGLCSVVEDDRIAQIVKHCDDTRVACEKLIEETKRNDAPDNVTIVAIRYDGTELGINERAHFNCNR